MERKSRTSLTFEVRAEILTIIDKGLKQNAIATLYNVSESTVTNIKRDRAAIMEAMNSPTSRHWKKARISYYDELEEKLLNWFRIQRHNKIEVSYAYLQEKAQEFAQQIISSTTDEAKQLEYSYFKASNGFISKFCERHDICSRFLVGEADSVNPVVVSNCRAKIQEKAQTYNE